MLPPGDAAPSDEPRSDADAHDQEQQRAAHPEHGTPPSLLQSSPSATPEGSIFASFIGRKVKKLFGDEEEYRADELEPLLLPLEPAVRS